MKSHLFIALITLGINLSPWYAAASPKFVAHEWGTFTSVQGADGVQVEWNPLLRTDLPSFVYDAAKLAANGCDIEPLPEKAAIRAVCRMETPVIYFYSPVERAVDVRVDFPQGRMTEWYPQASRFGPVLAKSPDARLDARQSFLEWRSVNILAPGTKETSSAGLLHESTGNHYYEARQTDANLLRVRAPKSGGDAEYERLLFYRGVGSFASPLQVNVSSDERQLELSTVSPTPLADLFVLTIEGDRARYRRVKQVAAGKTEAVPLASTAFSSLPKVRQQVMAEIKAVLVRDGLYPAEAAAMVNTWKDQWFAEPGTRVLFLLPRTWTDQTLPLTVNPSPDELVRVMVGRSEVIPPGIERELHRQFVEYSTGDAAAKLRAVAAVRRLGLGRFLAPAVTRALEANSDKSLADSAWKLTQAVLRTESNRG